MRRNRIVDKVHRSRLIGRDHLQRQWIVYTTGKRRDHSGKKSTSWSEGVTIEGSNEI